jgi:hypothetical protein
MPCTDRSHSVPTKSPSIINEAIFKILRVIQTSARYAYNGESPSAWRLKLSGYSLAVLVLAFSPLLAVCNLDCKRLTGTACCDRLGSNWQNVQLQFPHGTVQLCYSGCHAGYTATLHCINRSICSITYGMPAPH